MTQAAHAGSISNWSRAWAWRNAASAAEGVSARAKMNPRYRFPSGSGRRRCPGLIVNVTSSDAHIAHPKNAHYAAMKAAVSSLTKSFALEFAPAQILINAVAPAAIATGRAKATGWMLQHESETPLGRIAKPEDVADVILFLLSARNRYVTGENLIVSGAYTIV